MKLLSGKWDSGKAKPQSKLFFTRPSVDAADDENKIYIFLGIGKRERQARLSTQHTSNQNGYY
jgi:hypothetical protein